MKSIEFSSTKKRISIGFALIICLFILIGFVAIFEIHSLNRLSTTIHQHPLAVSNAALGASLDIVKIHQSLTDIVSADKHLAIEKSINHLNDEEEQLKKNLAIVQERILGPKGHELVNETLNLFEDWRPIREEIIELARNGNKEKADSITKGKGYWHLFLLENKMLELNTYARNKADGLLEMSYKVNRRASILTSLTVIAGVVLSLSIAFLTTRQVMAAFARKKEADKYLREVFGHMKSGGGIYKAVDDGEDFVILAHKRPADQEELHDAGIELVGRSFLDVFPESKRYGLFDVLKRVWKTGKPENHPVKIYVGDQITAWRSNYVFKLNTGEIVAIYDDITKKKQMEIKLLENESLFRSLFNTSPCAINMNRIDDGKFIMVNRKFQELTGYEKDEVIDKTAIDINIWKDMDRRQEFFKRLIDKREINEFEALFRCKDGRIITALVFGKLISYKNKPHLLAVTLDITQLKQIQHDLINAHAQLEERYVASTEKLKESEIKYASLVENMLTGVHMLVDGKIVFVNKKFVRMFGYNIDDLLGMNIKELIHPDDQGKYITLSNANEEEDSGYEVRGIKKNGDTIYLLGRNRQADFKGQQASLGIFSNITTLKEAEKKRDETEEELRRLSAQLLSAEERERKRIAREIHDSIGQSLSAIKFSVENAITSIDKHSIDAAHKALENIIPLSQQSIDEVRRIIMDLRPSTLDDLGLVATISWFCREFEAVFTHISVEREISVEEDDIPETLKIVIYRIMQEAFNNAAKYSGAEFILLRLTQSDGDLELKIEDTGVGFNNELITERERERRGLGLASMKERTYLSGGTIEILSVPGSGTMIHVVWPRTSLIKRAAESQTASDGIANIE